MNSTKNLLKSLIKEILFGTDTKSAVSTSLPTNLHFGDGTLSSEQNKNTITNADEEKMMQSQLKPNNNSIKQAACCLIFNDQGQVLSVSRKDNPMALGLPGGKVDPGETPVESAARELKEETGLVATNLKNVFSSVDSQGFRTTTFSCEILGDMQTNELGVVRWVSPATLANPFSSPFADYNQKMFSKLGIKI